MADLISQTRTLISDVASPQTFSDDDVQTALDRHRTEQRHVPLTPSPSFQPGGAVLFLDFYANVGEWEDDVLLQDVGFNTVTASNPEPIVGHWGFTTQPYGFGVRATGKTYDLYGAAADLLEAWAAQVKLDFTFQTDRSQYQRQQKFQMMTDLAQEYRKRALATQAIASQDEYISTFDGPAVTYPTYAEDW